MPHPTGTPKFDLDQAVVERPEEGVYRRARPPGRRRIRHRPPDRAPAPRTIQVD